MPKSQKKLINSEKRIVCYYEFSEIYPPVLNMIYQQRIQGLNRKDKSYWLIYSAVHCRRLKVSTKST